MRKRTKLLSALLAMVMVLGLLPAAALAAPATSGECGEYAIWSFDEGTGTLTISGEGDMDLAWSAEYELGDAVRSVVIEDGITYISETAFQDCSNLSKVSIPESVVSVGAGAFTGTLWLRSRGEFAVVNGILLAYQGWSEDVTIPEGVTAIGSGAFSGNETIKSVTIPEGVVRIGSGGLFGDVFYGCTNLSSITFPSTLEQVQRFCFNETKWLSEQKGDFVLAGNVLVEYRGESHDMVIPDGVTAVADGAFQEVGGIDSITVPASLTDLNDYMAFFMWMDEDLPKKVTYEGTQDQWSKVKGTEWLTENGAVVTCTGAAQPVQPTEAEAMPTNDKLTVNGELQTPTVYKINGGNYFKLRDLAVLLNGTSCQFDVGYDAASSSVTADSGKGYTKLDGDMAGPASGNQTATLSNDKIIVNGQVAQVEVYKIDGGNYFKLRDLGNALGFDVGWDDANKVASITTNG